MGRGVALIRASRLAPVLALAGCPKDLPEDQPCREAAFAIAGRAEQCTGDAELAESLYTAVDEDFRCRIDDFPIRDAEGDPGPAAYECALVTRNVACELAVAWADDVDAWLSASPVCTALLVRE